MGIILYVMYMLFFFSNKRLKTTFIELLYSISLCVTTLMWPKP